MHHCGGCPARWTGANTSHCSACHQTFSAVGPFDHHRFYGKCAVPDTRGLVHNGRHWGFAPRDK